MILLLFAKDESVDNNFTALKEWKRESKVVTYIMCHFDILEISFSELSRMILLLEKFVEEFQTQKREKEVWLSELTECVTSVMSLRGPAPTILSSLLAPAPNIILSSAI